MAYHANERLVTRVQQATGLTRRESQVAVMATTKAIIEQLQDGQEASLTNLGTFYFRMTPGRAAIKRRSFHGVITFAALKARPLVKFRLSDKLRKQLVDVEPEVVAPMHAPKRPTPSPSPSPGGSASPSNPAAAGGDVLEI